MINEAIFSMIFKTTCHYDYLKAKKLSNKLDYRNKRNFKGSLSSAVPMFTFLSVLHKPKHFFHSPNNFNHFIIFQVNKK